MILLWITLAFALGFLVRLTGLPPLLGFLAGGFLLAAFGADAGRMILENLADVGITLLLFSIGLKLDLRSLSRPEVWGVASVHMLVTVGLFSLLFWSLALAGVGPFREVDPTSALLLGFALSFSSTVFAVKVLEEKGEMDARHGRITVGILIVQDIAAVLFLAFSTGKIPTPWALLLLALIPLRPAILWMMGRAGHGELLMMFGLVLALVGARGFELVHVKGDLGALLLGVMVASHPKAGELSKSLLSFKDLFLVAFFLNIGLSGELSIDVLLLGVILALAVIFKSLLFFRLMTLFRLRARTAFLSAMTLGNYSEFGLIVGAIAVSSGWLTPQWLAAIAIALAVSFVIASPLNTLEHRLYARYRDRLLSHQRADFLPEDRPVDPGNAEIIILGMGRVGAGAYDFMRERYGDVVMGLDSDPLVVEEHKAADRRVSLGDATDVDFWERIPHYDQDVRLVMLAMPSYTENLEAAKRLSASPYSGAVAATVRFGDEAEGLRQAGVDAVFNIYAEAGMGFAEHADDYLSG